MTSVAIKIRIVFIVFEDAVFLCVGKGGNNKVSQKFSQCVQFVRQLYNLDARRQYYYNIEVEKKNDLSIIN